MTEDVRDGVINHGYFRRHRESGGIPLSGSAQSDSPVLIPEHVTAVEPPGLAAPVDEAPHGRGPSAGLQVIDRWLVF